MINRVAMICLHTGPLDTPGVGSSGGMNVYVRSLAHALSEAGVEVDIFTRSSGDLTVTQDGTGVRVIAVPAGGAGRLPKGALAQLAPECAAVITRFARRHELRYDVVHSHYWVSGLTGMELARAWLVPHVHMFHTLSRLKTRFAGTDPDPLRARGEQRVLDAVDAVVSANHVEAEQMRASYRLRGTRGVVIPCGVDLPVLQFGPPNQQSSSEKVPFTIVSLGRAERLKNFELLLHAVKQAASQDAGFAEAVRVRIAGGPSNDEPSVLPSLRELAAGLGLADHVQFLGPVPHERVPALYASATVCVVPSRYESFGLVAVEAMASRVPVIATRVGGLQITVDDGVNGFLVEPDDTNALAQRLLTLWQSPELRARLGASGEITAQHYAWPAIADRMLCLYDTLFLSQERASA